MRLLIASDIHGSFSSTAVLADMAERIAPDWLILLGDLLYHGPRNPLPEGYDPAKTAQCLNRFSHKIIAVNGNCDAEVDQLLLAFPLAPKFSWILAGGVRILASHGHLHGPEDFGSLGLGVGDAFLRGHSHVPEAWTADGVHVWNPGSLSLPKQGFPRSYAVYEDSRFRVLDLDGNTIMEDSL